MTAGPATDRDITCK